MENILMGRKSNQKKVEERFYEIIEDLEQQIAFEKQRTLSQEDRKKGWSKEYHKGYIAGLQQALDCVRVE